MYPRLWQQRPGKRLEALFTLDPWWLLGAAGCWFAYLFFDALGYHYFLRKQGYEVKLSFALYISLMGFYYSNITPGASGGQPMQIYYMNKKGVPIGIGTSGISMKFIANQLMTVLMASALWLWKRPLWTGSSPGRAGWWSSAG